MGCPRYREKNGSNFDVTPANGGANVVGTPETTAINGFDPGKNGLGAAVDPSRWIHGSRL